MPRVTLSYEELEALSNRLVPISPSDYDLKTYSILRHLFGRFEHLLLLRPPFHDKSKP